MLCMLRKTVAKVMAMAMDGFVPYLPPPLDGDGSSGEEFELGLGAANELPGAQEEDWQQRDGDGDADGDGDGDGEPDISLDMFYEILQEEPASALQKFQGTSSDGTILALGPPAWHRETEITPQSPAALEELLVPSTDEGTQELSWQHDMYRNGEGVEDTSEEVASIGNGEQIRDLFRRTLEDDMDFERPQQNDGSALASNCTHPGGVSPIVSRPSRSNSSSPVAMYDNYFASRNGDRVSFEQNSIAGNYRASSIPSINPVVDLTSDGSDEEESELREIGGDRKSVV